MSGIEFHNWDDGSVGVGSAEVRIYAFRSGKSGGAVFTTLAVAPSYLHYVGRPDTEDAYGVETIRAALVAKVAADFPNCEGPVRTTVSAWLALDGYGPRREGGIRFEAHDCEQLHVPRTEDEVRAVGERLRKSVADMLGAIGQYWDDQDQGPKAWAKLLSERAAQNEARSHTDV